MMRKFRESLFVFQFRFIDAYWLQRKQFQKSLTKQGLKFKLSTKVLSAEKKDGKVIISTEAAKDGKQDTVRGFLMLSFAVGDIIGTP